jgi:hypothetical protein
MFTANAQADTVREPAADFRRTRRIEAGLNQFMPVIIPQPGLCISFPMRGRSFATA